MKTSPCWRAELVTPGALEYLDDEGNMISTLDAMAVRRLYPDGCASQGLPLPNPLGAVQQPQTIYARR
jgi:hypothetical protein